MVGIFLKLLGPWLGPARGTRETRRATVLPTSHSSGERVLVEEDGDEDVERWLAEDHQSEDA
jgi:hypothetical protein